MSLKKRIEELEREVGVLKTSVAQLRNPPKYKIGDKVEYRYRYVPSSEKYKGIIIDIKWSDISRDWDYEIFTESKFKIFSSILEDINLKLAMEEVEEVFD